MGTIQLNMGLSISGGGGFQSAPLASPPIPTGMTDTLKKLKSIVLKQQPPSQAEYVQVRSLNSLSAVDWL